MRRLSLLIAAVALLAAACGTSSTPSGSPTASADTSGCAAQLATGERHYTVIRAELGDDEVIELADSGLGLSFGYKALSYEALSDGSSDDLWFAKGWLAEGLALYSPAGVVLMSGGLRTSPENADEIHWVMVDNVGTNYPDGSPVFEPNLSAPAEFAACPMFALPLALTATPLEQIDAAQSDAARVQAWFLFSQGGNILLETDPLSKTTVLDFGYDYRLVLEEQPSADYRD